MSKKKLNENQVAIKEMRLDLGIGLREAGERLGLSSKTVGAIENGRIGLSNERAEEISILYGLTANDLKRTKRIIKKDGIKDRRKKKIKTVLSNKDRRSYQKILTKECQVLKALRRSKGISQDKASELCGYPRSTIGHIENGRIDLDESRVRHIIKCYGLKFAQFEEYLEKDEFRVNVIDSCYEKIKRLDDRKLDIVRNLLGSM
jgi:transcriptional regulator with XRE-family HTH domain